MYSRLHTGLLVFSLLTFGAFAQSERGNITGIVTDASGAAMSALAVVITNKNTNMPERVATTSTGEYNAANLAPGPYRVEVSASGFKRFIEDNVILSAGATIRVDAQMQIGQTSESVQVEASATQLQTENARVSTTVQNRLVDELPLVVGGALRSPFDLVTITPEARGTGSTLSIGGGQAGAWGATLDGLSVNTNRSADATETAFLTPSVEAITEFAVDTNGFKAEYAQAGGGAISFVSKSGTNQYHGDAFDFLRNDDLDARGFFAKTRSIYKQNDFGATLGGPVRVPKLYNGKDKTFFFVAYEGFRNRIGNNGSVLSVPTPEMYLGDFSKWVNAKGQLLTIYDPATTTSTANGSYTRTPFAGNMIPQSRFSAVSRAILPYASSVVPNRGGIVPGTAGYVSNNYVASSGSTDTPTDKGSVRLDHSLTSKHHFDFFYNRTSYDSEVGPGGPPGLPEPLYNGQVGHYDSSLYRLTYDWIVSPTLLNHFSVGGNMFAKNSYSPNSGGNWAGKVCIKNAVDCNVNFPNISFTEFTGWGSTAYNGTEQPSWSLKNDLSYIRGNHTFKFGYAFESQRANGFGEQNIAGQASFSFLETAVPGATGFTSGSSFASFLLGNADSGATETIRYLPQTYDYHGFYAQDDWRVTHKLTVNFGLRYEFTRPPVAGMDQYTDFSPTTPNPAVNGYPGALIFAGIGAGRTGQSSLVPAWYGGIGPRAGFAYSVNDKTTVRAGFGRSFSRTTVVASSNHYAGFIGQYNFASTNQGITPAFNWDAGLPSYPLPPQINPSFSNNQNTDYWQGIDATRSPETLYWTFSVQRQITPNTVFEANYNATAGVHLQTGLDNINQVPMSVVNQLIAQYGATQAINLLNSNITSAAAVTAHIPIPYASFTDPTVQRSMTVAQALRPYPQYLTIDTSQGGDKSGHSTYNALVLRLEHRYSNGLSFLGTYSFSKLLTDSDTYYANGGFAEDQGNHRLEKSIGQFDQTHVVKLNTLYELPFGAGKRWLVGGIGNQLLGGWRFSAVQSYGSGFPIGVTRNAPLPISNGNNRPLITTYNWKTAYSGSFDPNVDTYLSAAAFPVQTAGLLGNATRYNPLVRGFAGLNENISLAKSFHFRERLRLDFRAEAFNLLNRTVFSNPTTNLNSSSFGIVSGQANAPRQMQAALKLYW